MEKSAQQASDKSSVTQPLQRALPERNRPGNLGISGKPVGLDPIGLSQDVKHVGPSDARRIVDSGLFDAIGSERFDATLGLGQKIFPTPEGQAIGGTSF